MAQTVPQLLVTANCARCVPAKSARTSSSEWPRPSPWTPPDPALHSGSGYPEEEAWFFVEVKSWSLQGPVCGAEGGYGARKGGERKRF